MPKLSFKQQIEKELNNDILKPANKAVERVSKKAWQVAVNATPRQTGRAKNGWKLNTGRNVGLIPAVGQYPNNPSTPNFSFDILKDSWVQIFNNVPYISYLENGQGPGTRTPHKMLFKAQIYFEYNLQRELNKI